MRTTLLPHKKKHTQQQPTMALKLTELNKLD